MNLEDVKESMLKSGFATGQALVMVDFISDMLEVGLLKVENGRLQPTSLFLDDPEMSHFVKWIRT